MSINGRFPGRGRRGPGRALRTLRGRRGVIVAYTAVAMAVMVGVIGFAVDLQRLWLAQARLKTALDAAALVAVRHFDASDRDTIATAAFYANFDPVAGTRSSLGASVSAPSFAVENTNNIRVTASLTVPQTLFRSIGTGTSEVTDSSVATRGGNSLELSIVLDMTGSMGFIDSATGKTKIEAAKAAVRTMLDVLFGPKDTLPNLSVALVPFARTMNFGNTPATRQFLDTSALPPGFSIETWNGCVEARLSGEDITETNPATPQGRFRPYYWADTYRQYGSAPGQCTNSSNRSYPADANGTRWCMADNDWGNRNTTELQRNPRYQELRDNGVSGFGPHLYCTPARILPLTASKASVLSALSPINAPDGGGTIIPAGLQAAWFTLSPDWRGWWPGVDAALPANYGSRTAQKAVVLLSDGDNNWLGDSRVQPSSAGRDLFYGPYGRVADQRLPVTASGQYKTTQERADLAVDARTTALCTAMKNRGIVIYVIGFEVAQPTHRALLQGCASSPNHYFESANASGLDGAFRAVAARLASLRLAE